MQIVASLRKFQLLCPCLGFFGAAAEDAPGCPSVQQQKPEAGHGAGTSQRCWEQADPAGFAAHTPLFARVQPRCEGSLEITLGWGSILGSMMSDSQDGLRTATEQTRGGGLADEMGRGSTRGDRQEIPC